MSKAQVNARLPEPTRDALRALAKASGLTVEEIILDALLLMAEESDAKANAKIHWMRETLKREHIAFTPMAWA